ncbi:MAG: glycosyltransferase family 39 protein [Chloroflexota bacterium]
MSVDIQSGTMARAHLKEQSRLAAVLRNPWLWVAGMTLVGFLLRRYHLGVESLWFDEADIVAQARQPLPTLIERFTKAGENGPLYTLMLHYWLTLGDSIPGVGRLMSLLFGSAFEAQVRGLSMLFGTAAIPVMFAFAKRVGGQTLGLLAAALLTFNPFHLWYSQDAKMYSMLVLMTLITSLLYLRAIERNTIAYWAAYVLATWVMLTAHSLAGLVLLAQIVATLVTMRVMPLDGRAQPGGKTRHTLLRWFLAVLIIVAPIFPIVWLRAAALVTGTVDSGNWYGNASLPEILLTIFVKFAVNQAAPDALGGVSIPWEAIGALSMAALALAGAWALVRASRKADEPVQQDREVGRSEGRNPKVLTLMLWLVPVLLFWVLTLVLPLFQPRYLIMALPSYLIMAGAGIMALRRVHPLLAAAPLVLLGLATGAALLSINYSSNPQKEDWRGAMVYVQDHIRLRDTIVVFPGYLESAVELYYRPGGPAQVPDRPVETVHSLRTENYGVRELDEDLRRIVACKERAWLVISPVREAQEDPQHKVLEWFQSNWHTFDTKEFNGVTVYGISFNGQPDCWYPGPVMEEPHTFEGGLGFTGYTYELRDDESNEPKQPDASYFPLTMFWQGPATPMPDYDVLVKVTDPSGKVVKEEALGTLNGYWPTLEWYPNAKVIDYRDIRLPGGLTPGNYRVSVQVFPKGQPDKPLKLEDGSTEIVFKQPLKVVTWKP